MDIAERKQRLDDAANRVGGDRVVWHGEMGDECRKCGVQVPEGYLLALPGSDVSGCLRCLEHQAHLSLAGLQGLPDDLVGAGDQARALRQVAEDFRAHLRATVQGRQPPSRKRSRERWAAHSGWESTSAWEPPAPERPSRWPGKEARPLNHQKTKHARVPVEPTPPRTIGPAEVLGLTGTPTRAEIISAFRRSALICHPDNGGTAEAFREIVEARDKLLDGSS